MNIVINPTKCTITSITASNKIAMWIGSTLKIKLVDDEKSAEQALNFDIDKVFIVNGMFAFCEFREDIANLCRKAREVIWVGNDYAIKFPSNLSFLKNSPKLRRIAQYSNFDNWANHKYVDFNKLLHWDGVPKEYKYHGLFYYGAFRKDRIKSFQKWLGTNELDIHVSTAVKNTPEFKKINRDMHVYKASGDIRKVLPLFQSSIYIEDEFTHNNLMTPANRFYEVIGSKTLLLYDASTKRTLDHAGFWDDDFSVATPSEAKEKLQDYASLRAKQIAMFADRDFRKELEIEFKAAV
jgi:hypothetical protein